MSASAAAVRRFRRRHQRERRCRQLELDQQPAAPITVTGFGLGDVFDLTNIPQGNVTFSPSDGSLTITENGTPVLTLEGDYSTADFTLEPDAFGGTEVFRQRRLDQHRGRQLEPRVELEPRCSGGVVDRRRHRVERRIYGDDLPIGRDGQANSLAITDRGATLTGSGTLSIATTLDNAGIIDATGCNFLHIETNTLINEYSGVIAALNGGDLTITDQTDSANYGMIKAANGGSLTINHDGTATNYGVIQAVNDGTIVFDNNQSDANRGEMKAADGGSITIDVALSEDTDGGNFGKMAAVAGGTFSVVGDISMRQARRSRPSAMARSSSS
jgi:hypothetical protein